MLAKLVKIVGLVLLVSLVVVAQSNAAITLTLSDERQYCRYHGW